MSNYIFKSKCVICKWFGKDGLCKRHSDIYMWDSSIQAFRLKKRSRGSRYTKEDYHKSEIKLTKFIEEYYGKNDVYTGVHPIWAVSDKKVLCEFDILIKSRKILVEYNGDQHYKFNKFFQKNRNKFYKQRYRDKKKYKLAEEHGYKVVIFKYDEPLFKEYILNKIEGYKHDNKD